MKQYILLAAVVVSLLLGTSCQSNKKHFISDVKYRVQVLDDLARKKEAIPEGNFFAILDSDSLTTEELGALQFLYAYMNIADIVDLPGEYYLNEVRSAFKAREEMTWGSKVPERIFRHFVLPTRVNNEYLDDSRAEFYDELKERVQGLSMREAALEVNHWCHEKATYAPSSARTRSPRATVLNAIGRCGEESTFTVAALRSVGIPARQVYTPRWAHTNDNHAWVEVWVDDSWLFLGACEPAPSLNDAWFNSSVVRAMLCHTNVFGRYDGPEEQLSMTNNYTGINVIENYAPTDLLEVKVMDKEGNPVDSAKVSFTIYNYSEFYPAVRKLTNKEGRSSLRIGRGDMLVWAAKDGLFGYAVSHQGEERQLLDIVIDSFEAQPDSAIMKIVPPSGDAIPTMATEEEIAICNRRLLEEDSIRRAYEASFFDRAEARVLAQELGVDTAKLATILVQSRGNHAAITGFLENVPAVERGKALDLLTVISEKDYTDTPESKLRAIYESTPMESYSPFELKYVLSPLVADELLTAYRPALASLHTDGEKLYFKGNPDKLAEWIMQYIRLDTQNNSLGLRISPEGVWRSKRADRRSLDAFFVSLARTIGIASRIDEVTAAVQYTLDNGETWHNIDLSSRKVEGVILPQGQLVLDYTPTKVAPDPAYYDRFTIAALTDEGHLSTLAYNEEGDLRHSTLFAEPRDINAGNYMLITGTRMASGTVLSSFTPFSLVENERVTLPLNLITDSTDIQVIGYINAEEIYRDATSGEDRSILSTTGRNYYAIAILGSGQEPTNHALKDLAPVKAELEQWGHKFLMLFPTEAHQQRFKAEDFPGIPSTTVFGIDRGGKIAQMLTKATNLPSSRELPIFVIADSFGRVVFVRQGYSIGIGEEMMQTIRKL